MKQIFRILGRTSFWMAWPLYIVYFKRGYGRTRVIVVRNGKILVVTNWVSDGKWSLPGGGLHKHESPLLGAIRELKEEVHINARPEQLRFVGTDDYRVYGHHFRFHCFLLELHEDIAVKKQFHEIADVAWVDPKDLTLRNAGRDLLRCLSMWRDQ